MRDRSGTTNNSDLCSRFELRLSYRNASAKKIWKFSVPVFSFIVYLIVTIVTRSLCFQFLSQYVPQLSIYERISFHDSKNVSHLTSRIITTILRLFGSNFVGVTKKNSPSNETPFRCIKTAHLPIFFKFQFLKVNESE